MERSRFALTSDVQIDVCAEHGMWLDGGELEEAVRFVARRAAAGPAPGDEAARSDGLRPQLNPSDAAYVAELERAGRASIERAVTQMQRERAQDGRYMPPELLSPGDASGSSWSGRARFSHWAFWPPLIGVVLLLSAFTTECGARFMKSQQPRYADPPPSAREPSR